MNLSIEQSDLGKTKQINITTPNGNKILISIGETDKITLAADIGQSMNIMPIAQNQISCEIIK